MLDKKLFATPTLTHITLKSVYRPLEVEKHRCHRCFRNIANIDVWQGIIDVSISTARCETKSYKM